MAGTSNTYHNSLIALKPLLPKGYQQKIVEKLSGFTLDQIKKAFTGRLKDEQKLTKILLATQKLARETQAEKKELVTATIDLLQGATIALCYFFVHN